MGDEIIMCDDWYRDVNSGSCFGVLDPARLRSIAPRQSVISKPVSVKKKLTKKCICGKDRHKSKGAAEAQIRALKKLQTTENGKRDFKNPNKLNAYPSNSCKRALNDGYDVWHVGHR